MARPRNTYTAEFKLNAVRMVTDQELSVAEAARRLGIVENLLELWKKAFAERSPGRTPARLPSGTFLGANRGAADVAGLGLSLNDYAPDLRTPPHAHTHALMYLVLNGTCEESSGRSVRTVGPAAIAFHPAGETHATRWAGPGGSCFHVEFRPDWVSRLGGFSALLQSPADFRGGPPVQLALRLFREFRRMDAHSQLVIEGLALELVAEASRRKTSHASRHPPPWLARVSDYIRARFAESLTLGEVAVVAEVHPVHLATVFRRHHGCTVGEYVRRRRVEVASGLLRTSASLVEIALAVGFADQAHFCRTFKQLTGLTPGEFRAQPGTA